MYSCSGPLDVWMKLKAIRKNKLSEKDGNSILGYCILKRRFFIITRERKFLNEVYVDNVKL